MRILTFRARRHRLLHEKPFKCLEPDCERSYNGFSRQADLSRHLRNVHDEPMPRTIEYQCKAEGCPRKGKSWYRADNFREHCRRLHPSLVFWELMEKSLVPKKFDTSSAAPERSLENTTPIQRHPTDISATVTVPPSVAEDRRDFEDLVRPEEGESSMKRAGQIEASDSATRNGSGVGVNDSAERISGHRDNKPRLRATAKCSMCRRAKLKVSDQP